MKKGSESDTATDEAHEWYGAAHRDGQTVIWRYRGDRWLSAMLGKSGWELHVDGYYRSSHLTAADARAAGNRIIEESE